jgi:hypothetical protein
MSGNKDKDADLDRVGVGLSDAICSLREELLEARLAGSESDIQLPVESLTIELQVVVTRTREGKAGFRVPFVDVELGGSLAREREATQTVTVTFGGPVDREGRPVKVAQSSDRPKG